LKKIQLIKLIIEMNHNRYLIYSILAVCLLLGSMVAAAQTIDFSRASISVSPGIRSPVRETLVRVLQEEVAERTSINLPLTSIWESLTIALVTLKDEELNGIKVPKRSGDDLPETRTDGFQIYVDKTNGKDILWMIGADERGVLYAIGHFLRTAELSHNKILFRKADQIATSPEYPIRGHQIGYRDKANSYDAWDVDTYEQHIRELAIFGANSIENIPFDDEGPLMKLSSEDMNREISEICRNYGLDYWVWTPIDLDISDESNLMIEAEKHIALYKNTPKLDDVFFPGGDPGDNHPKYIMPLLEKISAGLHKYHPNAGIWLSLQGFNEEQVNYFFQYLEDKNPEWFTGVVSGPGSPDLATTRFRLSDHYRHRHYPDITHTIRCQYPVENFDQAYSVTQGREICNPQPYYYARIHNRFAPFTDGFVAYSDGMHDDVNKAVWSQMGWNTELDVQRIVTEYSRFFFGLPVADAAATGIIGLEGNWNGPILENSGVETTLAWWQKLESDHPELQENWRWQKLLKRAYFDAFLKKRKYYEENLEKEANLILVEAESTGSFKAMENAMAIVNRADTDPGYPELRQKVVDYFEALFHSIGLQSSVEKHKASASNRAPLDYIDHPLNNRWWLADEFEKIRQMPTERERLDRLEIIRTWENPGTGSYYDNIQDVSKGPRVTSVSQSNIGYAWWDGGRSRKRLSTQLYQNFPVLEYTDIDPEGHYIIRVSGYGEALLRVEGERLRPLTYNKGFEEFKEFIVPRRLLGRGSLKVTFDEPEESHLNWRHRSWVSDVWLLKK
jgi:hypothetical protein